MPLYPTGVSYSLDFNKLSEFTSSLDRKFAVSMSGKAPPAMTDTEVASGAQYTDLLSVYRLTFNLELSALLHRLNSEEPMYAPAEKQGFLDALLHSLKPSASVVKNIYDSAGALLPFPTNESDDTQVRAFLTSFSSLTSNAREIGVITAAAALALLESKASSEDARAATLTAMNKASEAYRQGIQGPLDSDFERNGVIVRRGDEVLHFRDEAKLRAWGRDNGLSGEQIDLAINFTDQGTANGWPSVPSTAHAKRVLGEERLSVGSSVSSVDPTAFLEISDKGVTLSTNFRSDVMVMGSGVGAPTQYTDGSIATLKLDVTSLRAERFMPGLPSSGPLTIEADLTFLYPELLSPSVPALLRREQAPGPHIEDYAARKTRAAASLKHVADLHECSYKPLRDAIARHIGDDARFSRAAYVETIREMTQSASTRLTSSPVGRQISIARQTLASLGSIAKHNGYDAGAEVKEMARNFYEGLPEEIRAGINQPIDLYNARGIDMQEKICILQALDYRNNPTYAEQPHPTYAGQTQAIHNKMLERAKTNIAEAATLGEAKFTEVMQREYDLLYRFFPAQSNDIMQTLTTSLLREDMPCANASMIINSVRNICRYNRVAEPAINRDTLIAIAKNAVTGAAIQAEDNNIAIETLRSVVRLERLRSPESKEIAVAGMKHGIDTENVAPIVQDITSLFNDAYGAGPARPIREFVLSVAKEADIKITRLTLSGNRYLHEEGMAELTRARGSAALVAEIAVRPAAPAVAPAVALDPAVAPAPVVPAATPVPVVVPEPVIPVVVPEPVVPAATPVPVVVPEDAPAVAPMVAPAPVAAPEPAARPATPPAVAARASTPTPANASTWAERSNSTERGRSL